MPSRRKSPQTETRSATDSLKLSRRTLLVGVLAIPSLRSVGCSTHADQHSHDPAGKSKTTPYSFGSDPPRVRKSFYDWSDAEVELFCRAIAYLRDGPSLHEPLQWDNLVAAHADHCVEPNPATGPDQVHWSWFFLPWHRAYLFFMERHIANAIRKLPDGTKEKADAFGLPYWDWVTHKGMPNTKARERRGEKSPFFGLDMKTDFDPAGQGDPKPYNLSLFDGFRGPTLANPEMDPRNEDLRGWKEYTRLIRERYTSQDEINDLFRFPFCQFAGRPTIDKATGQGALENDPHNMIHDWVGMRLGNNRDMGNLRYAALDPIFYLHHANIDWIWSRYPRTPDPGKLKAEPNCASVEDFKGWLAREFAFRDIDGKIKAVTVKDTLTKMSTVSYAPPASAPQLVKGREARPLREQEVVLSTRKVRLTNKAETFKPTEKALLTSGGRDVRRGEPGAAVLEITVGDFSYARRFQVRVFVNKPDANEKTPYNDEHFVGLFQALNSHTGSRTGGNHVFVVNVSPKTSRFFKVAPPGRPFTLTLVPIGTSSPGKPFFLDVKKITLSVFE